MGGRAEVEDDLLAPGDHDVDSTVICVVTRFAVRRPWHLLQTFVAYRRLLRRVRRDPPPGFLHAAFLLESPTVGLSLSIWADETAIAVFGTAVPEHVDVARRVFGRLRFHAGQPEIWSTKWQLRRVSRNLSWGDFDLRSAVVGGSRQSESPRS